MESGGEIIFLMILLALLLLWYVLDGYLRLLSLSLSVFGEKSSPVETGGHEDSVSVVLPVFNGQGSIITKLENLLNQAGVNIVELIVVDDGSTDRTAELVSSFDDDRVMLCTTSDRAGKSIAQNLGVKHATSEIIVLTDVDTVMEESCIRWLIEPFRNKNVGCTTGRLSFVAADAVDTGEAVNRYWDYEMRIRDLESRLGMLATATGAVMAVRAMLWRDIEPHFGDDCVVPLDVIQQGFSVVHVAGARARDVHFPSYKVEFKARARMVLRNWTGTWSRGELLNPFKNLKYAFALWSHKILRWLMPLYVAAIIVGALIALNQLSGQLALAVSVGSLAYLTLNQIVSRVGLELPFGRSASAFLLANLGFLLGLILVVSRIRVRGYTND